MTLCHTFLIQGLRKTVLVIFIRQPFSQTCSDFAWRVLLIITCQRIATEGSSFAKCSSWNVLVCSDTSSGHPSRQVIKSLRAVICYVADNITIGIYYVSTMLPTSIVTCLYSNLRKCLSSKKKTFWYYIMQCSNWLSDRHNNFRSDKASGSYSTAPARSNMMSRTHKDPWDLVTSWTARCLCGRGHFHYKL